MHAWITKFESKCLIYSAPTIPVSNILETGTFSEFQNKTEYQ